MGSRPSNGTEESRSVGHVVRLMGIKGQLAVEVGSEVCGSDRSLTGEALHIYQDDIEDYWATLQ